MYYKQQMQTTDILERIAFNLSYEQHIKKYFETSKKNRVAIICAVRDADLEENVAIQNKIVQLSKEGKVCYYPKDFNDQEDEFKGLIICNTMNYVIRKSTLVAVNYNPTSEGTRVDIGMTFMLNKPARLLNNSGSNNDVVYNFIKDLSPSTITPHELYYQLVQRKEEFLEVREKHRKDKSSSIDFTLAYDGDQLKPLTALEFGMLFAGHIPFKIANKTEVQEFATKESGIKSYKSYTKVALMLDKIYATR